MPAPSKKEKTFRYTEVMFDPQRRDVVKELLKDWVPPPEQDETEKEEVMEFLKSKRPKPFKSNLTEDMLDEISDTLYEQSFEKKHLSKHTESLRADLPANSSDAKANILKALRKHQVVVIEGQTGCGKTTQIPQMLLDHWISRKKGGHAKIICTQPRRISATSVARRVAYERGEDVGISVGFHVRHEKSFPRPQGSIMYCTSGILLQQLLGESDIPYSHIIIDEAHERNLTEDFLLLTLKNLLNKNRHLKVIVMSATLDTALFKNFFGDCPIIEIPGRTYPVKTYYLEDVISKLNFFLPTDYRAPRIQHSPYEEVHSHLSKQLSNYSRDVLSVLKNLNESAVCLPLVLETIFYALEKEKSGDVLVFLPGWAEISRMTKMLENHPDKKRHNITVLPLHSRVDTKQQSRVFDRIFGRKVVLSSQIAETSVTVDGVVSVIDTGKDKYTSYDAESKIGALTTHWVSKSGSKQRAGRAGRTRPGVCYKLYSSLRYNTFDKNRVAEICRSPLEQVCLQLGSCHSVLSQALEPPAPRSITLAIDNLVLIGAAVRPMEQVGTQPDGTPLLEASFDEVLTPLGCILADLPIDPTLGKFLVMSHLLGVGDAGVDVTSALAVPSIFSMDQNSMDEFRAQFAGTAQSDHVMYLRFMQEYRKANDKEAYCAKRGLSSKGMTEAVRTADHLDDTISHSILNSIDAPSCAAIVSPTSAASQVILPKGVDMTSHVSVHLSDELDGRQLLDGEISRSDQYSAAKALKSQLHSKQAMPLLRAALGSGTMTFAEAERKKYSYLELKNKVEALPQKSSALHNVDSYAMPQVTYYSAQKSGGRNIKLRDVSTISPAAVITFCRTIKVLKPKSEKQHPMPNDEHQVLVLADDHIRFMVDKDDVEAIIKVRQIAKYLFRLVIRPTDRLDSAPHHPQFINIFEQFITALQIWLAGPVYPKLCIREPRDPHDYNEFISSKEATRQVIKRKKEENTAQQIHMHVSLSRKRPKCTFMAAANLP